MKRTHTTNLEKRIEDLKEDNRELQVALRTMKKDLEIREAELQLREQIYHAIPSAIIVIQEGRIMDVNGSATEQLGYEPKDLVGRSFLEIVDPGSRDRVREIHARRLARKNVPEQYEAELRSRNGSAFSCEVRVRKILLGGKRAFVVSLTPMDLRKEREENRVQAKKMEAVLTMASALASRFEGTCSAIQDQVRRLRREGVEEGTSRSRAVRELEAVSSDALRMTEHLKTIARKEGAIRRPERFDFRRVVKEAVTLGRSEWEKSAGTDPGRFHVKTYLRSGSHIRGSSEALRGVVAHLIRNALEAMPGGGDLYVTSEENEGAAHLFIMDSGVGVSETVRDRIFDPFFTTREGEASGLGLSVAYAVIRQHGGEIEVTSEKSQGTEIHISIPVAPPEEESGFQPNEGPRRPARILVMARTVPLRDLLSRILTFRGWEVLTAAGAAEGLGRLRGEAWGGVILEPAGRGLRRTAAVCRRIKALDPRLPVILIAENGAEGDLPASPSGQAQVDLVAHKPLHMERFQDQVLGLLRREGAVAARRP